MSHIAKRKFALIAYPDNESPKSLRYTAHTYDTFFAHLHKQLILLII